MITLHLRSDVLRALDVCTQCCVFFLFSFLFSVPSVSVENDVCCTLQSGGGDWSHSTAQWCMLKQLHASWFGRTVGSIIWTNQTTKGSIRKKSITIDFFFLFCAAQFCTTYLSRVVWVCLRVKLRVRQTGTRGKQQRSGRGEAAV